VTAEEGEPASATPKRLPSLFSSMTDPLGYNARFLSAKQINSIQETEFRHRKPLQDAKMMGLTGSILKIDWSYKVAGKTYVYTRPGVCFKPYTNMRNVQNEDGLTLTWKMTSTGETLDTVKPDLLRLERRNKRQQITTKVVYINDCCKFRSGLKRIFGGDVFVGLDVFHWCKRWDAAMANSKSENGAIFRSSISQALFVVPPAEFERAKARLIHRHKKRKPSDTDWQPTVRQIRKEANAVIPPPDTLQERVMAFIRYAKFCDAETDVQIATRDDRSNDPLPLQFFKRHRDAE